MERREVITVCRGAIIGGGLAYIALMAAKAAGLLPSSFTWTRVLVVPGLLFASFAAVPGALYPILKAGKSGLAATLYVWIVMIVFGAIYMVVLFQFWI